MTLTTTS